MPNVCMAAGVRLSVLASVVCLGGAPAWGQYRYGYPYDAGNGGSSVGLADWGTRQSPEEVSSFPQPVPGNGSEPSTISTDVLRHPLSSKARRLFEKAMHFADLGNHHAAITGLREALLKCPTDAPYAENLLGLEYIEARQYNEAKASFTEAARLMPHESGSHSNLGLSMAIIGEWDSAEQEERKALQLDKSNDKAKLILEALLARKRGHTTDSKP
ncbi:MAG: tetratricopeptide repeat protein [Acidobacteriota bacterium]|nr:tetratricopeptide repeat protein [Acidobacteriota bacterium]